MGILLVFDLTDERSFNSQPVSLEQVSKAESDALIHTDIRTWHSNVEQHASDGVNKILIGNKCDWENDKKVSTQGISFVDRHLTNPPLCTGRIKPASAGTGGRARRTLS